MRPVLAVFLVIALLGASVGTIGTAETVETVGTAGTAGTASVSVDSSTSHRHLPVDSSDGRLEMAGVFSGEFTGIPLQDVRDDSRACPVGAATAFPDNSPLSDAVEMSESQSRTEPHVAAVYPNPTTHGNVGEFFVLKVPARTRFENWTVTDGHTTAAIPDATVSGPVALSMDPDETASMTTLEVLELEGHLWLAADGDTLRVLQGGTLVDEVTYDRARTARVWYRSGSNATDVSTTPGQDAWWPRGATCLPVATYGETAGTAFVLPDAPDVARDRIAAAEDRIRIAGYTFTSPEISTALEDALERGVDVEILVEAGPVGGASERTDELLTELESQGADVYALGGPGARYRYHHPKYAVVDETVLVTTENWSPSGLGGASSRGWGVVVENRALARDLEGVFRADADGWDVTPWAEHRKSATFVEPDPAPGAYPTVHEPEPVALERVELLLAPDNAEGRLLELLEGAEESIDVTQASIGDDASVLEATIEAAERGVEVRVLLDASWYNEEANHEVIERLETAAARDDLPLEARLVEPGERFEKIHAKGVIVDGDTVVLGSLNWKPNIRLVFQRT
ncbi:phospholipase D-like domain-containing protein [Natronosalvus caseinilyticus]|uniref:phospholipase D-like domain-containing protein n=1 Tax=Natronosalvus caseinilyticus TaxID=2953747 RepID=UPI0028A73404|nr:phospholipase D-like domain-containing protein [Natronosalvus caseinilyticus]